MDTYINCCNCNWVGMASGVFCPSCGHNCYPSDDESLIGSNPVQPKPDDDKSSNSQKQ